MKEQLTMSDALAQIELFEKMNQTNATVELHFHGMDSEELKQFAQQENLQFEHGKVFDRVLWKQTNKKQLIPNTYWFWSTNKSK